jgi:hypothetical protein
VGDDDQVALRQAGREKPVLVVGVVRVVDRGSQRIAEQIEAGVMEHRKAGGVAGFEQKPVIESTLQDWR